MKRISYLLLFVTVLWIATTDFSGCGSFSLKTSAKNGNDTGSFKDEPNVTFKDLDGNNVSLASLKGKVVLVNFWGTFCEPCQVEIPWLIEFQQKYSSKGFTVLGVAVDDEGKSIVEPFVQKTLFDVNGTKEQMNYPIVLNTDAIDDQFGGLIGYPTSFLISRDGRIHKKWIGLADYEELEKEIQSML
jgi:thiol-disulfide isomerase/thioredoxin